MVCYFKPEGIEKHHAGREDMHWQFAELRDRFLGRKYQTERGHEFEITERDTVFDATLTIQAALAAAQQAAEDEDLLGEGTADVPPVESPDWLLTREEVAILQEAGVELEDEYARNLERLMEGPAQSPFRLPTHQKGNCAEQAFYPSISLFKIIISLTNTAIFFAAEGARHSHFMRNSISKFLSSPEHVGGRCRAPGELYSFSNNIRFVAELSE
ncbi:hypothetical protein EN858_20505 [Mesorhizobium sp. M4B.F.Ca.ET.215.01.1.1]|uniref:Uncharacterized protein n=3 Tax=Phyllobacteriaceae TaxID=69277 RepID=A0A271K990_9HYPH|nr:MULTISPECIES: hypothetical protein [unclassified Mesorhizobium]PAP92306.1 hypothetical protein CIT31_27725 [Mesorhizobium wenxiniae]RVD30041.1 hypothetical protein EN738_08050 [Mesorhizobium sp. M4B.F.Ca.ET.017.02.2.1]RWA66346.1 MAG: hypothetical protein EOQ27_00340 [Mesorhizobium sp.]TGQ09173.1 hypothetical protein EN858_20505 [Mesorhizobium sp. M4B.F.Ca.ET.215.01.1.1]TGQ97976.1 hypothetical protein EN846_27515 [Mesorhizobium sp. M4B.F.Ca.ET.203.01.1.1]TGR05666.1 hypothetical protein EN84